MSAWSGTMLVLQRGFWLRRSATKARINYCMKQEKWQPCSVVGSVHKQDNWPSCENINTRYTRFPFGMSEDLKYLGCRKLKRVNTGVPIYIPGMSLCGVRWCCAAATATAVQRLYCAGAFQIPSKCGLESSSLCSEWHAHVHTYIHTYTHRSTVRSCSKKKTSKCGCCCTMAAAT